MTRTLIAVELQSEVASGSPSMGTVCIRPTVPDYQITTYSAGPQCGQLDTQGRLTTQRERSALTVFASDDEGFDTTYNVQIDLYGQPLTEFNCKIPAASTATELAAQTTEDSPVVSLTSLIVSNAMLGQTIVGDNWPADTVVTSVSFFANSVTLSQNATVTGVCEATVSGAVNIATLEANRV